MALTDYVAAELVKYMDRAFNTPDAPPVGDLSGGTQLRPGNGLPGLDNFEDCTMAWVTAGARGKTTSFPTIAEVANCEARDVFEFSIGIARCSTALEPDGGYLPSIETMEHEFAVQEDDKDRLQWVTCNAQRALEKENRIIGWAPSYIDVYGPEGATIAVYRSIMVEPTATRRIR